GGTNQAGGPREREPRRDQVEREGVHREAPFGSARYGPREGIGDKRRDEHHQQEAPGRRAEKEDEPGRGSDGEDTPYPRRDVVEAVPLVGEGVGGEPRETGVDQVEGPEAGVQVL